MTEQRIGSTIVHQDAAALILHCPALRSAGPALMLALFGTACGIIALASFAGLVGSSGDAASRLLALAFGGVFVLPLLGIGVVFVGVALWNALNTLTVATTTAELRMARRWCGIAVARQTATVASINAIDCVREARFTGIFSRARYFRLLARTPGGAVPLADHLNGREESTQVLQLLVDAMRRPDLTDKGRRDDLELPENAGDAHA